MITFFIGLIIGLTVAISVAVFITFHAHTAPVAYQVPTWVMILAGWGAVPSQQVPRIVKRAYHGLHRREDLLDDVLWRTKWASYDTQQWPTLASDAKTSGQILDLRPEICRGRPADPEPGELPLASWAITPGQPRLLGLLDI